MAKLKDFLSLAKNQRVQKGVLIFTLSAITTFVLVMGQQKEGDESPSPRSVDTHIPQGMVLAPIKIENFASLDKVIGKAGVVDLYHKDATQGLRLVGQNVRLVRSELVPEEVSVLVPKEEAAFVLKLPGPFKVTVKAPSRDSSHFESPSSGRKIIFK